MYAQAVAAALAALALMSPASTATAASVTTPLRSRAPPIVQLDNGLQLQGRVAPNASTVVEFLGVPFAQPPLSDLRWMPPQEYQPASSSSSNDSSNSNSNSSVFDATVMPPSCWQYISRHPGILRTDAPEFMIGAAGMSEDCLKVSVWAPAGAVDAADGEGELLPVLIWFYGGGFATGGIDVPYQYPVRWVERSQSHIVVVFK